VLHCGDQPGRAQRSPVRRRIERDHRLNLVVDVLRDRRNDRLACMNRERNAVDRDHDFLLWEAAGRGWRKREGLPAMRYACVDEDGRDGWKWKAAARKGNWISTSADCSPGGPVTGSRKTSRQGPAIS